MHLDSENKSITFEPVQLQGGFACYVSGETVSPIGQTFPIRRIIWPLRTTPPSGAAPSGGSL